MRSSYIFIFLTLVFLAGTVSAVDLTIPFGVEHDLKRPCFNNGTFCSASAVCNITVSYPDGTLLLENRAMTRQSSYFNITILQSEINQLGTHPAIVACTDTGGSINGNGGDTFNLIVTADGNEVSVFPIQLSFLIIGLILIMVGKVREDFRIIKHLGSIIIIIIGVLTLWPGFSLINYSTLLGKTIGFSSIGLGFYFWVEDSFSRKQQTEYYEQDVEEDGRFHEND